MRAVIRDKGLWLKWLRKNYTNLILTMRSPPHSHSKRNKVPLWPDPDKITALALLEAPFPPVAL